MGWGGAGGPCDYRVSPSPFGLDFGTLDFGTSDLGLTIFIQYKISKPERESESESEDEEDTFGPSTARKDNVNWTDVKDVTRESWKDIWLRQVLKKYKCMFVRSSV